MYVYFGYPFHVHESIEQSDVYLVNYTFFWHYKSHNFGSPNTMKQAYTQNSI